MRRIRIYTTRWCGFCVRAKTLLDSRGLPYEELSLDDDPAFRQTVYDATGGWTAPLWMLMVLVLPLLAVGAYAGRPAYLEDQLR